MADVANDPQVKLAREHSRLERSHLTKRISSRKCCQCNGNGSCVRCQCAATQRPCSSCLPLSRSRCTNPANVPPASVDQLSNLVPSRTGPSSSCPGQVTPRPSGSNYLTTESSTAESLDDRGSEVECDIGAHNHPSSSLVGACPSPSPSQDLRGEAQALPVFRDANCNFELGTFDAQS